MLPHREANFRRVLGVLFEDMRLDTPLPEDLSADRLMATTAGKPTDLANGPSGPPRFPANIVDSRGDIIGRYGSTSLKYCHKSSKVTRTAAEQLLPLVYDELRNSAGVRLSRRRSRARRSQATALGARGLRPARGRRSSAALGCRGHFFAAAAEAMRRILVDNWPGVRQVD